MSPSHGNWHMGAILTDCLKYRYMLWRRWDKALPILVWIMLNPSTASHEKDDPTIRKICKFSQRSGFGGAEVYNLFAYRSPDRDEMAAFQEPIGVDNDYHLARIDPDATIVAAWGELSYIWRQRPSLKHRDRQVIRLLDRKMLCLKRCGQDLRYPQHPLYIRDDRPFEPFIEDADLAFLRESA